MQVDLAKFHDEVRQLLSAPSLPSPQDRYSALGLFDPFPDIPPALLHSGHLASYAIMTGMIDPFEIGNLNKPATYLVPLEGPVRYADEKGNQCSFYLSREALPGQKDVRASFELKPNSICYITLRPRFRMPAYLAGRFNLLIRDVYRGLLVGTGPLVDPGFDGVLSIPVHNFTSNKYTLSAGEGFVYFEFTKLSWSNPEETTRPAWVAGPISVQPPFPPSKSQRKNLDDYIVLATGAGAPQNAIHLEIRKLSRINKKARRRLGIITAGTLVAALLFAITVAGVLVASYQLFLGVQQYAQAAQKDLLDAHEKLNLEIKSVRTEQERIGSEIKSLHSEHERLGSDVKSFGLEQRRLGVDLDAVRADVGAAKSGLRDFKNRK